MISVVSMFVMRILLIQSYIKNQTHPIMPLGLLYLCKYLQKHNIKIFDPNVYKNPIIKLEERIKLFEPELIGISIRNIDSTMSFKPVPYFFYNKEFFEKISQIIPSSKIIVGGSGFRMFSKKIMESCPQINIGVITDRSIIKIANRENLDEIPGIYYRVDNKLVYNSVLDNVSDLQYNLNYKMVEKLDRYNFLRGVGVRTKVGCSFNCSYCIYKKIEGEGIKLGKIDDIVNEIKTLNNKFRINNIFFADCQFNNPLDHSIEILERIIKENIKITWGAYFNLKNFTKDYYQLCLESGCRYFEFSPDSIDNRILKNLNKNLTTKDIYGLYRIFRKKPENIRLEINYLINAPGENVFSALKTIFLLFYHKLNDINGKISNIRIYPDVFFDKNGIFNTEEVDSLIPKFYNPEPYNLYTSIFCKLMELISYKKCQRKKFKNDLKLYEH